MPKVSVVIPCYNHGQYLDEAVDSILKQTYQDFEIIIVNDGSTDPLTIEKLRAYRKPKTTVIHTENGGPSAARNTGIRTASGEYILTLDADDWFEETFVKKATSVLEQSPEIGVVTCGRQYFGSETRQFIPIGGNVICCLAGPPAVGSALFRKICWEQAGGYDERMKKAGYEDWNFWIDVTKRGWLVHVIPEYLFHYRRHPQSRNTLADKNRPDFVRQIVRNHREVFQQYVEEVIVAKEEKMCALRQQKRMLANSWSYKLGSALLLPFRMIRKTVKSIIHE